MLHLLRKNIAKPFTKTCNLYIDGKSGITLTASTYNHGGLNVEKPNSVISGIISNPEELGQQIKQKLNECEYKEEFNYSNAKKSDWPAYKASGLRTIKTFEATFIQYTISGANSSNIILTINSPAYQNNIQLTSSISASATPFLIGEWAIKFHSFFLKIEKVT